MESSPQQEAETSLAPQVIAPAAGEVALGASAELVAPPPRQLSSQLLAKVARLKNL